MVPTPENSGPRTRFQIHSTGAILLDVTRQPTWMHSAADLKSSAVRAGASRAQHGHRRSAPLRPQRPRARCPLRGPRPGPPPSAGPAGLAEGARMEQCGGLPGGPRRRHGPARDPAEPQPTARPHLPAERRHGARAAAATPTPEAEPRSVRRFRPPRCAASGLPPAGGAARGTRSAAALLGPCPARGRPASPRPCLFCSVPALLRFPARRQRGFAFAMRSLPVG